MTPEERNRLATVRFTILSALRASGVVLMLIGMWIWHGDIVRTGGWPALGLPIFVVGFAESLLLPRILARRWRSPPES
ncbi:MAG TPA: hypothetical protein VNZ43_12030 [Sphingomonadaceae bacterium]|jgi:hypothetical protein|nr:hypothetical protein [Sphingomonadaceae bacterium]